MQPNRWQRVKRIFGQITDLPLEERDEALRRLCGADRGLRLEVDRMLRVDADAPPVDDTDHGEVTVFQAGDLLADRFLIEGLIGSGGMGEVYRAHDRKLGEAVAIKAVHPEFVADRRFRERFRREMQLARQVAHPNICRIHDLLDDSAHPDRVAFTMELVEGPTLAQYLAQQGKLSPASALPLVRQMCGGLEALHREGIVHRDLKPGNIILAQARRNGNGKANGVAEVVAEPEPRLVKITDFGLARRVASPDQTRSGVTNTRDIVGTPRYMAPEQLTSGHVTPAADIYALGLLLYEMLTGQLPFPAEGVGENAIQKSTLQPEAPSRLAAGLPSAWDAVVLQCLDVDPAKRPSSAQEVADTLEASALHGERWAWKRLYRRRAGLRPLSRTAFSPTLLAAVALLSLLGVVLSWALWSGAKPAFWNDTARSPLGGAEFERVAVLPFDTMGGTEAMREVAAGLTDVITKGLSQYEGVNQRLSVIPASEVRRAGVRDAASAFKMLGANRCIEGTLEVGEENLQLILTVVDGENLRQMGTTEVIGSAGQWTELRRGSVQSLAGMMGLQYPVEATAQLREPVPGAEVWYLQGVSYLQRTAVIGDLETAYRLFQQSSEADPRYASAHAGLGEAAFRLWEQGRDPEWMNRAIAHCRRALALDRTLPEARITLGMILRGTGKYEESIAEFDEVLRHNPRNGDAFKGKADTYTYMGGRDKEAIATYHRALELRPADAEFYLWLGNFHFKRDNLEDAFRSYQNVIAMMPDNPKGYTNSAAVLMKQDRFEDAIPILRRAIEIDPTNAAALGNMGYCFGERQDYARAAAYYEQAVQLKPNDFKLVGGLASTFGWMNDPREQDTYRKAARLVAQEVKLNPKREDLYSFLAMYHAGARDDAEARRWLGRTIRRGKLTAEEQARIATIHARLDLRKEALYWARNAVSAGYEVHRFQSFLWLQPLLKDPEFPTLAKAS